MRVAAIDCGTNTVRLLVADITAGHLVDVVRRAEIVRLGQGVDRTGHLAPAALARVRAVLADYAEVINRLEAERVRLVATSATRDAANANEFAQLVIDTLGVTPDVISGNEEARLAFIGAVRELDQSSSPYLVLDLGGGSTELVLGSVSGVVSAVEQPNIQAAISLDIGSVRLTERHFHTDPPTSTEVAAAVFDIRNALDKARVAVPPPIQSTLVGVAGTVTTLAAVALGLTEYDSTRVHGAVIPVTQINAITERLIQATHEERAAIPVIHPGRVDVITAGALIVREVMGLYAADSLIASEHDILDGVAYSLEDR